MCLEDIAIHLFRISCDVCRQADFGELFNPWYTQRRSSQLQPIQLALLYLLSWVRNVFLHTLDCSKVLNAGLQLLICGIPTELGTATLPRRQMAGCKPDCLVRQKPHGQWHMLTKPRGGITLLHIPCTNFAGLFVVRFLLGMAEACIVPAFLLTLSMFFTYDEQAILMPCMWAVGNASPITSGLLSYATLFIHTGSFSSWKWFMGTLLHLWNEIEANSP